VAEIDEHIWQVEEERVTACPSAFKLRKAGQRMPTHDFRQQAFTEVSSRPPETPDSVVLEIKPYSDYPNHGGREPKIAASPLSPDADVCSPK